MQNLDICRYWFSLKICCGSKNRQKGTYNVGSYKVLQMQFDERTSRLIASEKYYLEEEPKNLKQGDEVEIIL